MNFNRIPVEYILKAAKAVKRLAYLIAVIGAAASYGTQVELLVKWGLEAPFTYAIPATIDLLAIAAAIALQVPGFPDLKSVGAILFIGLAVSIAANITAGENAGQKIAHAWPVIAYMLAEYVASRMRRYAAIVQARKDAQDTPQVQTAPVQATAAVVKPTPTTTKKPAISAKARILELASVTPPLSPEAIADKVGTKPGWVKHVIKTSQPA